MGISTSYSKKDQGEHEPLREIDTRNKEFRLQHCNEKIQTDVQR